MVMVMFISKINIRLTGSKHLLFIVTSECVAKYRFSIFIETNLAIYAVTFQKFPHKSLDPT